MGKVHRSEIYTNLRAYIDLGFNVEVIQFHNKSLQLGLENLLPSDNIRLSIVDFWTKRINLFHRIAFYLGIPQEIILDYLYPIRPFVIEQVKIRNRLYPNAIHHFEYDQTASCVTAFKSLKLHLE